MNQNLLIAKCAHFDVPCMPHSLLIAKRAQLELARMPPPAQRSAELRRLATPRNASQRVQYASRGIDTLNGRSATRRPEKETNQMQCTEDIVLHRHMRLRQHVQYNQQLRRGQRRSARAHITSQPIDRCCICVCMCMGTSSGIQIRIRNYVCAHNYTRPVLTTPPEREPDYTTKERDFYAQERVTISGATNP